MRTEGFSNVSTGAAPWATRPGPAASPPEVSQFSRAELLGALQALLEAYGDLQARLSDLEQLERLRAARSPRPDLGIDP